MIRAKGISLTLQDKSSQYLHFLKSKNSRRQGTGTWSCKSQILLLQSMVSSLHPSWTHSSQRQGFLQCLHYGLLLGAMSTHLLSSPRFYYHVIHSTWHREHILWLFWILMFNPNNHHSLLSCMCTSPVSGSITFGALSTISDTVNALFLLSFRHSLMITRSPLVHSLVSSCAKYTFLSLKY